MQATLVSWPELLKDTEDKTAFFTELSEKYVKLRDHIAAISYALPAKIQGNF